MFHNKFVELIYILEEIDFPYSVNNDVVKVNIHGDIHQFSKYDERYIEHIFRYIDEL